MDHHDAPTRRAFLAGLLATPILAACGGGDDDDSADTTRRSTTTTTAAPTTAPPPPVAPLTGIPWPGDPAFLARPALVVKIDNADSQRISVRPQAGINQADVVIEELVEGGVTRLAAVFHSADADPVGPIRSGRRTDLEYVGLFGQPLFAWSGGNAGVVEAIRGSGAVHDIGYDAAPGAYFRAGDRPSPHNLMSSTAALYEAGGGAGAAPGPLLPFSAAPTIAAPNWRPATGVDIVFATTVASAPSSFDWDPGAGLFLRTQKGSPHTDTNGSQVAVTTVVVLFVDYLYQGDVDSAGTPVPEGNLLGGGTGVVLAAGMAADVTWSHPERSAPMALALADGSPLSVPPGRSWWSFPPPGLTTVR